MATTTATTVGSSNPYEDARNQRLQENKRRFQDLGISKIAKSLSEVTNSAKKSAPKPKPSRTSALQESELRRSSRERIPVVTYTNEVGIDFRPKKQRKRSTSSSWTSYLARPIIEVKLASNKERASAMKVAEKFQSNLPSKYPSFVKSMVRSHVYSCFWLGLPTNFCKHHLPSGDLKMVLEDDQGLEYDSLYIGSRKGLSGGWRAFALEHKLDDGDALVFQLNDPTRFKVYIFKVRGIAKEPNGSKADKPKAIKSSNENGDAYITKSRKILKNSGTKSKKVTFDVPSSQEVQPVSESSAGTKIDDTVATKSEEPIELSQIGKWSASSEIQPQVDVDPKFRKRKVSKKLLRKKPT